MNEQEKLAIEAIEALAEETKKIAIDAMARYVYLAATAKILRGEVIGTETVVLDLDALTELASKETH